MTVEILCVQASDIRRHVIGYDCLMCDPPYEERVHSKATSNGTAGAGPRKRDLGFNHLTPELRSLIGYFADGAKRWAAVFSALEGGDSWREAVQADYIRTVPWVRWSQPQLTGGRPPSGAELVLLWHAKGRKMWSGPGGLTHFDQKSLRGADKYSCEKPLDLMLALVSWFSEPGELILDPVCGSGTTGLAAMLLGRRCVMTDRSEDACDRAWKKIHEPLIERDVDRLGRFVDMQRKWLAQEKIATAAAERRHARAVRDADMAAEQLGRMAEQNSRRSTATTRSTRCTLLGSSECAPRSWRQGRSMSGGPIGRSC